MAKVLRDDLLVKAGRVCEGLESKNPFKRPKIDLLTEAEYEQN